MRKSFKRMTAEHELRNKNGRITVIFSALILCLTIAALVLPAVALSKKEVVMDCPLAVHEHSKSCYQIDENGNKVLACGQADYVVHTHDEACYDSDGNLICTLPEIQEHTHDESCYEEQQVLVCDLEENEDHTHTDECYKTEKVLICGQDELHTHNESCFDAEGNLICGKIVLQSHQHDESCMKHVEKAEDEPESAESSDEETELSDGSENETELAAAEDPAEDQGADEEQVAEEQVTDEQVTDEGQVADEANAVEQTEEEKSDSQEAEYQDGADLQDDAGKMSMLPELYKLDLSDESPVLTFEECTDDVTVHVEADRDAFPEGTTMKVKAVAEEDVTEPISDAVDGSIRTIKAVDITFLNDKGKEIEPAKPIRVSMTSKGNYNEKKTDLAIVHVDDSGKASKVEEVDINKKSKETTASFEAGEFSVYAVVYTVDFHWEVDGKSFEFSIPGGGYVSLGQLVEALGIAKDSEKTEADTIDADKNDEKTLSLEDIKVSEETWNFIEAVEKAEFSTPELVWVGKVEKDTTVGGLKKANDLEVEYSTNLTEKEIEDINAHKVDEGDWALISLLPFTSEESLTVTMKNGDEFKIQVTDNQANDPYGLNNETFVITTRDKNYSLKAALQNSYYGHTVMQSQTPSGDSINHWIFEYDENAFNGAGGYYIRSELNGKYLNVSDYNLTFADVKSSQEATEPGQKTATPFSVSHIEKADTHEVEYRFSTDKDGQNGFLTFAGGNPSIFGIADTKSDDNFLILRDPMNPSERPGTVGTWDIKADGITLKLFNYSGYLRDQGWVQTDDGRAYYGNVPIDKAWAPSSDLGNLRNGSGINYHRSLLFSGSGLSGSNEGFNNFTGTRPTGARFYSGYANQNIVNYNLGTDKFPTLRPENIVSGTLDVGEKGSLGYLFDDNPITNAKEVYLGEKNEGLDGLLRKDVDGYYYYSSEDNYARLDGNEVIVYSDTYPKNLSNNTDVKTTKIGLFPFTDYDSSKKEEKGPNKSVYDHQFGMTLNSGFVYPKNGIVPNTGKEMTFSFSGDDDVWVFIDGVLVLDLGGVHQPIRGEINFATGKVNIYEFGTDGVEYLSSKSTTIDAMFAKATAEARQKDPTSPEKTFDKSEFSKHTFDFFYLERGGCDSNCSIKFNLLMMKTLTVAKKLNGLTPQERQKYLEDKFTYELGFKHDASGIPMHTHDEDYWDNTSWRNDFSTYNTVDTVNVNKKSNYTIKTDSSGARTEGVPISEGQIHLKANESMTITHLPITDIFYLAEENELDMAQFETPHAERIYQDAADQKKHEEEVHLHEDTAAGGTHQSDWETRPYGLNDTERLVYTNTLKEKNLDVEKRWSDILTNSHTGDEVEFKLKAWVKNGDVYQSYQDFTGKNSIYAQWTQTQSSVTTTKTGDVLAQTFKLKADQGWKLSFEHLPKMTPSADDTGKEIFYTVEEVTKKDGYSSKVSPMQATDKVYLDIFKLWPDGNESHDGHTETIDGKTVEFPTEHITTYVKRSDGMYLTAHKDSNGEYVYDGVTDNLNNATKFELVSKTQLPNNLKTSDQKEMFDYAARINNIPSSVNGVSYTYTYDEKNDEDKTTTGLVMFTRPKEEIEIYNDTSVITVEKEWLDADGNKLAHHPSEIGFDVYQSYHKHNWGAWTNAGNGTETRTCQCDGCTANESRTIDDGGHDFVKMRTVTPTCDEKGYDLYICSKDPSHIEHRNETNALGHNWGSWTRELEPTKTEKGLIKRVCSRCSEVELREIEYGQEEIPGNSVTYLPESLKELNDPDKGNYVKLYKYSETLATGENSETKRTEGNSVYWTRDYTYPKYDADGNEYTYYIFETSPRSGYKTTYTYFAGAYNVTKQAIDYTKVSGSDIHNYGKVHISNTLTVDLDMFKTTDKGEPLADAVFRLEYKGPEASSYTVQNVQAPGDGVKGITFAPLKKTETIVFDTEKKTFTIPEGGVKISSLKEGIYKLVEVTAPEGYVILEKNTYVKVDFSEENQGEPIYLVDENGRKITQTTDAKAELSDGALSIQNEPGAALPSTGGPGTRLYMILGFTLAAGAGLLLWRRRRLI